MCPVSERKKAELVETLPLFLTVEENPSCHLPLFPFLVWAFHQANWESDPFHTIWPPIAGLLLNSVINYKNFERIWCWRKNHLCWWLPLRFSRTILIIFYCYLKYNHPTCWLPFPCIPSHFCYTGGYPLMTFCVIILWVLKHQISVYAFKHDIKCITPQERWHSIVVNKIHSSLDECIYLCSSGLNTSLQTKRSLVWFPVKAHA